MISHIAVIKRLLIATIEGKQVTQATVVSRPTFIKDRKVFSEL